MKLAVTPRQSTWWVWLVTAMLLLAGLTGFTPGFMAAIGLSLAQSVFFWRKRGSIRAISVQNRAAYTALLIFCLLPGLRWLYWLPTMGTFALTICGYCLMSRLLSLMPWNRTQPLTLSLLLRTFLTAPVVTWADLESSACGGERGVCELEAQVASLRPSLR